MLVGLDLTAGSRVTLTASPDVLWPPNHGLQTITVRGTASGEPAQVAIRDVRASEPDAGLGADDVPGDVVVRDGARVDLRPERDAKEGRTYTITAQVTAPDGQIGRATVDVRVPHDRGRGR